MFLDIARTVLALLLCAYTGRQIAWRLRPRESAPEQAAVGFIVVLGWITVGAYVLGEFRLLANKGAWFAWLALGAALGGKPVKFSWRAPARTLSRWARLIRGRPHLALACAGVAFVAATNLVIMFCSAPNSWDANLYHLTRVGYYLQHGTFDAYGANFFSQEQLGKNSAAVLACLMAVSRASDWTTGLPQFFAWIGGGVTVYAIVRTWRKSHSAAAFAGVVWMLLEIAWLEATTAQNDVLIATEIACAFLFLRWEMLRPRLSNLVLAGIAFGLAVGTKASALTALPALALAVGPRLWRPRVAIVCALATLPFVLPAGYVENARRFGNPLGREAVSEHVYLDRSLGMRFSAAAHNALRFACDFFTLDMAPPPAAERFAQAWGKTKRAGIEALARHGFDLTRKIDTRMDFWSDRAHRPDENLSFFGPFGLFVAAGFFVACARRSLRWTAAACLAFFVVQTFAGPYDSIRGRLFLYGAVFAFPGLAFWAAGWKRRGRASAALFVVLALVNVVPAAIWRNNFFLLPADDRESFWHWDRVRQMTNYYPAYPAEVAFAERVPRDAHVGVAVIGGEYPLFGPHLTRTLVPVRDALASGGPLPADLDFLVFENTLHAPQPGDIALGANWFLRPLKK